MIELWILETDTPVMSNMRKIPMRRETIKALEVRRNTVMGEARRRSTMRTLGANNEFNRNKNRHRNGTAISGNIDQIYSPSVVKTNEGYEMSSDEEKSIEKNSVRLQTQQLPAPVSAATAANSQL